MTRLGNDLGQFCRFLPAEVRLVAVHSNKVAELNYWKFDICLVLAFIVRAQRECEK